MTNYVWLEATVCVDLPEDTPQPPEELDMYDIWYATWVYPTLNKLYMNPIISDIDVHEEGFEIGD